MNDVMEETLKKNLEIALKYNNLADYLLGRGAYFVSSDRRFDDSAHAFYNSMLVYNDYNRNNPNLRLSDRYLQTLLSKMKGKLVLTELYGIFKCVLAQNQVEANGKSSLTISAKDKEKILTLLKKVISENKSMLEQSTYKEGQEFDDGVYGYMNSNSGKVF